jgi:hypothetical protein
MAWKKIDDFQTQPDMPYSSFLANGLTKNVNSYNQQLTRGGGIAWNANDRVTWASYFTPQGLMFTVDVGQQVLQLDFRVKYATITGSADEDGFQGLAFLTHLGSGEFVQVGVLPTTGSQSYFDVSMPLSTAATGPQAFSLTFRSYQLESKGLVDVQGGVENTIYLDQRGGAGSYNITQGEKFELLSLAEIGHVVDATGPSTQDSQYYQINYLSTTEPHPPDGYASVVPSLTSNPPRLNPTYTATKIGAGTIFELGAFTLYSIAYNVVAANPGSAPPQYAHNTTTALSQVINIQNTALRNFQMDLSNGVSQRFALGAVVAGAVTIPTAKPAQKLSFSFSSGAAGVESELCVTFSAFTLTATSSNQKIRLNLYSATGTLLHTFQQTVLAPSDRTKQCVAGITARGWYDLSSVAAWGMRDSMPDSEMLAGTPQTFIIPSRFYERDAPFTIELSVVGGATAFYLYNLYARFIVSAG